MKRLALAAALCLPLAAAAQVTTLKMVSAFPENSFYVTRLLDLDRGRERRGQGAAADQLHRRAEGDPDLRGGQGGAAPAWSTMAMSTGAFYTNVFPESDALKLTQMPVAEQRRNGAFDYIQKVWAEKGNMLYLARVVEYQPFHLYLNKPIDKPDLKGLKIRITPVYRDFFSALGATVMQTAPGRGLHRARARRGRRLRLADRRHLRLQLAGADQVPRRPRLLRRRGVADHEPGRVEEAVARRSASSSRARRSRSRDRNDYWKIYGQQETERQAKAGIKVIKLRGRAGEAVRRPGLRGRLGRRSSRRAREHGPKMRQLFTKK